MTASWPHRSFTAITDSTEAERRAVNGESTRRNSSTRKNFTHCLPAAPTEPRFTPHENPHPEFPASELTDDVDAVLYDRRNPFSPLYLNPLPPQAATLARGVTSGWNSNGLPPIPQRQVPTFFGGTAPSVRGGTPSAGAAFPQSCYNCGEPGHISRNCPKLRRLNPFKV